MRMLLTALLSLAYSCSPVPAFAASYTRNQVPIKGYTGSDPAWPYQSGTRFTDAGRAGFALDVIVHGSSTQTIAGTLEVKPQPSSTWSVDVRTIAASALMTTAPFPSATWFVVNNHTTSLAVKPDPSSTWNVDIRTVSAAALLTVAPAPTSTWMLAVGQSISASILNTISQGDVNNASKAANMSVTNYANSASGSAGHAVATISVGAVQTVSSTRFYCAATGSETTFVFPRGTNWIEIRAAEAASSTNFFYVNSVAAFAKIETGAKIGGGYDAEPYREPNVNFPVTGGTRYISASSQPIAVSIFYGQVQ